MSTELIKYFIESWLKSNKSKTIKDYKEIVIKDSELLKKDLTKLEKLKLKTKRVSEVMKHAKNIINNAIELNDEKIKYIDSIKDGELNDLR